MKPKFNNSHKMLKIHFSIISFITTMLLIFMLFFTLVPKDYKGELNTVFLDTPLAKIIQEWQENTLE